MSGGAPAKTSERSSEERVITTATGSELRVIRPAWAAPQCVRAAFTLRSGGVSRMPYDSLNLGSGIGDEPEAIDENRRRVREALRLPSEPLWLNQVHGIGVVEAGLPLAGSLPETGAAGAAPPVADAVIARVAGRVCAIRVADCMPVLFAARDGSVVGAAHAGWRGLAGGVLEATISRLRAPPAELVAWLGPAIGPENFEVGDDVRDAFAAVKPAPAGSFVRNARGRWQCDLYALARQRLLNAGVTDVQGGGWCTFADRERFFSFRRDGQCGRMAALIWIEARQAGQPGVRDKVFGLA